MKRLYTGRQRHLGDCVICGDKTQLFENNKCRKCDGSWVRKDEHYEKRIFKPSKMEKLLWR